MTQPSVRKARRMTQPKYLDAVIWISENDSPGDDDDVEILSGLVTVCMVADLFNIASDIVAQDVLSCRGKVPHRKKLIPQFTAHYKRNRPQ